MAIASFLDDFCTSFLNDENLETNTLIWLHNHLNRHEEKFQIQQKFQLAINHIKTFNDTENEECKQYIEHLSRDDRVVLVTSGTLGKVFVPYVHHFRQIILIYIFCMDKKKNDLWAKDFIKIKGVFVGLDELLKNLVWDQKRRTYMNINEPLSISTFTTSNNLDQSTTALNYKFVYRNLFLDSLLQIKPSLKAKDELISRCFELYKNNASQQLVIDEFKRNYTSDRALWWYTRETFLYRLLNKALRIQNIDLLFVFRFFINDIQKQLEIDQCSQAIRIYRAQLMSKDEINEIKKLIGQYISINSFFSTSRDRKYALFLLGDTKLIQDDLERVLFEIDANPEHIGIKPFADISSKSYFSNECEVLIMFGAIFRLNKIFINEKNIWIIQLSLCSDQDYDLKYHIEQIRREYNNDEIDIFNFGRILLQMNKYDQAEKYYRRLLTEFSYDYKQTSLCYYHLGRVYSSKGNYQASLKWYQKSLKIMMETTNSTDSNMAECWNSMANIYRKKEEYEQALVAYQKAITIWKQVFNEDHIKIAMCLINMGVVYDAKGNYTDALDCLRKALIIKEKYHGRHHPDVAVLYNNIGLVYECLNQFDLALENFKQALDIYRTPGDLQNVEFGTTLENIGYIYKNYENWREALRYLEETVRIYRHTLSPTHPRVVQIEKDIEHISSLINN